MSEMPFGKLNPSDDAGRAPDGQFAGISRLSFERVIENVADGILVVDLSGAVLYANPAAAQIFGQPQEKLLRVPLGRPVVSGEATEITINRPGGSPAQVEMRVVELGWDGHAALLASLRDVLLAIRGRVSHRVVSPAGSPS